MKKYLLGLVIIILTGYKSFAQASIQRLETIDALDTVAFDLSQATINGNYIEFPVSILSDDTIYALDFSLKYNESHVSYDSIIDLTSYLQSFSFYNNNDSTLRFTSNSLQAVSNDTPLVSIRFNLLTAQIANADFNTIKAYLNGTMCSIKLVNAGSVGLSELEKDNNWVSIYPNPANRILNIEANENATIQCFDFNGNEVVKQTLINANQKHQVNIKNIANGIYIMKIYNKHFESIKKVVVSK